MNRKQHKKKDPLQGANPEWAESLGRRTGAIILDMPLPEGKVSDIVAKFADPLVNGFAKSDEEQVDVLVFACYLWNLAIMKKVSMELFSAEEASAMHLLADAPFFLRADGALNLLSFMLKRWETDFAWCRRVIVDKHIVLEANGIHMSVVSSPIPDLDKHDSAAERGRVGGEAEAGGGEPGVDRADGGEDQGEAGGGVGRGVGR